MRILISTTMALMLSLSSASANANDPNINYIIAGDGVSPWELSLQFGKVVLENKTGESVRSSLVASPATRNADNDALSLTWAPKGIKNEWGTEDVNVMTLSLINRKAQVDLMPILDQAALTMDVRVVKAPKESVTLILECGWDWKCRADVPLKSVFRNLPRKKWVSVPIPLRCFLNENEDFDFSKLTSILLQTTGKMEIEISDLRLTAFPADKVNCG